MAADLVERLEIAAKIHDDMTGKGNAMAATIREAASALRSSGEAVAYVTREGNLIGGLVWTDAGRNADLPDGTKLYLHPATVTDEGVTQIIRLARRHEGHDPQLRAALSSFVRPTPPASTKGG